jgi:hypothetical protein
VAAVPGDVSPTPPTKKKRERRLNLALEDAIVCDLHSVYVVGKINTEMDVRIGLIWFTFWSNDHILGMGAESTMELGFMCWILNVADTLEAAYGPTTRICTTLV